MKDVLLQSFQHWEYPVIDLFVTNLNKWRGFAWEWVATLVPSQKTFFFHGHSSPICVSSSSSHLKGTQESEVRQGVIYSYSTSVAKTIWIILSQTMHQLSIQLAITLPIVKDLLSQTRVSLSVLMSKLSTLWRGWSLVNHSWEIMFLRGSDHLGEQQKGVYKNHLCRKVEEIFNLCTVWTFITPSHWNHTCAIFYSWSCWAFHLILSEFTWLLFCTTSTSRWIFPSSLILSFL